jgi:hypothetical protein
MRKWLTDRPYASTSAVFLVIMVFGWWYLGWRWEKLAFMLLLYFIVTLGIRLDEIAKRMGPGSNPNSSAGSGQEDIISLLKDIKISLNAVHAALRDGKQKDNREDRFSE